jgi:hypothetical protein
MNGAARLINEASPTPTNLCRAIDHRIRSVSKKVKVIITDLKHQQSRKYLHAAYSN